MMKESSVDYVNDIDEEFKNVYRRSVHNSKILIWKSLNSDRTNVKAALLMSIEYAAALIKHP